MKRALISVYDKTGIVEFAKKLVVNNYEIISTSGTAKLLSENGIVIKTIEELTQFPEILNGRVKTLHPAVFAGLLADTSNPEHIEQMKKIHLDTIDLLVVNLYPFAETIRKPNCTNEEAIEQIDIGGVSLIRAAAKNHNSVSVIVSPDAYVNFINHLNTGSNTHALNLELAADAFNCIADYDADIANYFNKLAGKTNSLHLSFNSSNELRYGENPHQKARMFYYSHEGFYDTFKILHGKELSYNNLLDIDGAYNLINEFDESACAIVKHTNPCGAACDNDITQAYIKALACDNVSAFGGIVIINRKIDLKTALEIDKIFTEIIVAPDYDDDAKEQLFKKKNRRILKYKENAKNNRPVVRSITGGLLAEDKDDIIINEKDIRCVTKTEPDEIIYKDLIFAMKIAKHTKSNSVVYVKNMQTIGIGGGQPSRVDSSRIAVEKAKRFGFDLQGCSVASDAFFPFADGVIEAAKAGAKFVIQPGGSVRDDEVIKAADEYGIAMIFTGIRHFRH
jgi:phosphoribosylaminoimidazolecarboxamide formyltransferase/IMP cyclohydrolase